MKKLKKSRFLAIGLSLFMILALVAGGTMAYLSVRSNVLVNVFTVGEISCETVDEQGVNVRNTGNIEAYVRVRLVSYRVNDAGQHIGGEAPVSAFTSGDGWIQRGGYYYYTSPVAPGAVPAAPLIAEGAITFAEYDDEFGGRQQIDVLAEAIQATPNSAVSEAWGFVPGE